jgi:hypothetical protein
VHPDVTVVDETETHAVGYRDNLVLLGWRTAGTMEGARAVARAFDVALAACPDRRLGFVTLIEKPAIRHAPNEVRSAVTELLRRHDRSIGAAVVVFEGHGFLATVVRSIITAINLASRASFPNAVFAEVEPAVAWLAEKMGRQLAPTSEQLVRWIDGMRGTGVPG